MLRLKSKTEAQLASEDFRAKMVEERNALSLDIAEMTKRKNQILLETSEAEQAHGQRIASLDAEYASKKSVLLNEVLSLEARQREALKPVKEREQEVSKREAYVKERGLELDSLARSLSEDRSLLVEKVAEVADRLSEVASREKSSETRLLKVQEAEEVNRRSTEDLAIAWFDFRSTVRDKENAFEIREDEIKRKEAEVSKEKEWVRQERGANVAEKRRNLSDRASLEDAIERAKKKGII